MAAAKHCFWGQTLCPAMQRLWLAVLCILACHGSAYAPQRRWLASNSSGGAQGDGRLPPVDAVEAVLATAHARSPTPTVADIGAGQELPPVDAVEAMLQARWADGPPPPLPKDAAPPPKLTSTPTPGSAADPCRGGPPCPPGSKNPHAQPKAPLKSTNLTGAFRGIWHLPRPAPAGPFYVTEGDVLHQIKAWRTNASNVQYLQSALLLRDGDYSTPHDSRVSLEGVYLHKESKVAMFSRHGSHSSFTPKRAANISTAAANFLRRTEQARHYAEKQPRFSQEHFSTSFTNSRCSFFVLLDVATKPAAPAEQSGWSKLSLASQSSPARARTKMAGRVFSPECNIDMTIEEELMNYDEYYSTAFLYTAVVMCSVIFQIGLFVKQMEASQTQASITRISPFTIALQAGMDAFLCLMHLTTGIIVEALFNAFALCAFCKFILFAMFEMRYFTQVWKAQLPTGSWPDAETERSEISKLYTRFYSICIAVIFAGYKFPSQLTMPLIFVGYSFWLPQIILNVLKDADPRRPAFSTRYVVGMTLTRLLVPLYLYGGWGDNYLHMRPNLVFCVVLVAYTLGQMAIVLAQQKFGAILPWMAPLVPAKYKPYNYHRKPARRVKNEAECVICMTLIEDTHAGCMMTPCDHIFHADCLQQWMDVKMECPSCRASIP